MQTVLAFIKYLVLAIAEGDALNDWLTHLPQATQPYALALGNVLACNIPGLCDPVFWIALAILVLVVLIALAVTAYLFRR